MERAVSVGESERVEIEGRPRVRLDGYERAEMQVRVKDWGVVLQHVFDTIDRDDGGLGDEHST